MSLLYDRYLHHFEAGQQALQDDRHADARRELLQASRYILRLAEEGDDPAMQRARKRKGLQLLELAQSISAGISCDGVSYGTGRWQNQPWNVLRRSRRTVAGNRLIVQA